MMKISSLSLILIIVCSTLRCDNKLEDVKKNKTEKITVTKTNIIPPPPTPPRTSPFSAMEEWLLRTCETETPEKASEIYHFRLIGSEMNFTIWFFGSRTEQLPQSSSEHTPFNSTRYPIQSGSEQTHFNSSTMYYPLKTNEFLNLTKEQVLDKITSQLKAFTNTDKFKKSFFAKAKAIVADFNGETIWRRDDP